MSFPTSPTDGQVYTTAYGSRYRYYSADDKWVKDGFTLAGVTGAAGVAGAAGVTGLRGLTGVQGFTGVDGKDIGVTGTINVIIDGGGSAITTGVKADIRLPFGVKVESWNLVAKETGSILLGVWRDTYANFPPTSTKALHSGATGPTLAGAVKNTAATTAWGQPTGAGGEYIRVNVDSVATVQQVSLALNYIKI